MDNCVGEAEEMWEEDEPVSPSAKKEEAKHVEDKTSEEEESRHFAAITRAFRFYHKHSLERLKDKIQTFGKLKRAHRQLLNPVYISHINKFKACVEANAKLIPLILEDVEHLFENQEQEAETTEGNDTIYASPDFQMEKLQSTLRQIARDWFCSTVYIVPMWTLLWKVEKTGLGRLAWELARLGYTAQGNEFSLYMLFVSNFILNKSAGALSHTVYPYVHQSCNHLSFEDVIRPVHFPDVDPALLPKPSGLSMAAGEFLEVYEKEAGEWDCVASVFFLDTAHNPLDYIERIYSMLKPGFLDSFPTASGGLWVNLGPLLYHYADMAGEDSLELPWTELRRLIPSFGFRLEHERFPVTCHYADNPRSLLQHRYNCIFFTARKPKVEDAPS